MTADRYANRQAVFVIPAANAKPPRYLASMRQLVALAMVLAVSACSSGGGSETATPSANCVPLSKAAITSINEGATGTAQAISGQAVKLPGDAFLPMFTYIAAVNVKDGDETEQVFLTVDDPTAPNGIFAADNVARVYFEWGASATKGSPAANAAEAAWTSDAANEARGCLKN